MDYKKYSLEQIENWIHDSILCDDITPHEIIDTIKNVVSEQYYYHKHHTSRCYELLALLNNNGKGHIQAYDEYINDGMNPWGHSDLEFAIANKQENKSTYQEAIDSGWEMTADGFWIKKTKENKKLTWVTPVEVDGLTGDCIVTLPDDLLKTANLKEGDVVEFIVNDDNTISMIKTNYESEQDKCREEC